MTRAHRPTPALPLVLLLAAAAACAGAPPRPALPAPVEAPAAEPPPPAPEPEPAAVPAPRDWNGTAGRELLGSASYDLPVEANQLVASEVSFLVYERHDVVGRWLDRSARYADFVRATFAAAGLPRDLHHLAMVESGYQPTVRSRAGAVGMWQFMAGTGRGMGLRIDDTVDERMDPVRSTRAAARHLRQLWLDFGRDWPLAAAAYNAGGGRIRRGVQAVGARSFWELAERGTLAQETKRYVPRLFAVTIIARDPGRFGYAPAAEPVRRLEFDSVRVDLPTPLPVLARLAGAPVPPTGLAFRAMVLVYLVHTGGRWTDHDAHYLPGPQTRVTRLSEPANYRASRDDPADRSVLCAEIPCAVGDPVWTSTPDDLAELVRDGLRASGLPAVRLGGVEVRRLPHVYPVYEIGYADRLRPLDEWADGLDRVTTFGRLGLFAHDNSHHAMAEALDAVAALRPDGTRDPRLWAAARARFAAHVVED